MPALHGHLNLGFRYDLETENVANDLAIPPIGNFYTDKARQVQRFIPVDADTLIYEATVIDPTVFTREWKLAMPLRR